MMNTTVQLYTDTVKSEMWDKTHLEITSPSLGLNQLSFTPWLPPHVVFMCG